MLTSCVPPLSQLLLISLLLVLVPVVELVCVSVVTEMIQRTREARVEGRIADVSALSTQQPS